MINLSYSFLSQNYILLVKISYFGQYSFLRQKAQNFQSRFHLSDQFFLFSENYNIWVKILCFGSKLRFEIKISCFGPIFNFRHKILFRWNLDFRMAISFSDQNFIWNFFMELENPCFLAYFFKSVSFFDKNRFISGDCLTRFRESGLINR